MILSADQMDIRKIYDEKTEMWFFSVIDVVAVLTGSADPNAYWRKLKQRLVQEGSQTVTNCHRLKLTAQDGRKRLADVADAETMFRIIQSIPSPNAEPVKMWLARMGHERIEEMADPEKALNRTRDYWRAHGRSEEWIGQRMMGQKVRNDLTDRWKNSGVTEGKQYAILTDIIHKGWTDMTVKEHKSMKGLSTQNLRDHMTPMELILTALAEQSTKEISEKKDAQGFSENAEAAKAGGQIAKNARVEIENKTGQSVLSNSNFIENK